MEHVIKRNIEDTKNEKLPEYFKIFFKFYGCSIHHAIWKILGVPMPRLFSRAIGIKYNQFVKEYKYSLYGYPSVIDDKIELATGGIIGAYDKYVISLHRVTGKYYNVSIVGFGKKYARENTVTVRPPLNITGYQGIYGLRVIEFTDMNNTRFYLVFENSRSPAWRIVDTDEAKTLVEYIRKTIKRELRDIIKEIPAPVVIDPITPRTYKVYQVTRKNEEFAYYHARKHLSKEVNMKNGVQTHQLLAISPTEWSYIYSTYAKIGPEYLLYFYVYTF